MSRRTRQPLEDQQPLDWDRGAQLTALLSVPLPDRITGLGSAVSRMTAVLFLRTIDDFQRDHASAWPTLGTIAQGMQCSVKTVQRCIDALESLGLITVFNGVHPDGSPRLEIAINWPAIFGAPPAPDSARSMRRRGGPGRQPNPAQREHSRRSIPMDSVTDPVDILSKPVDILSVALLKNRPKNRPPQPCAQASAAQSASWGAVEVELSQCGVTQWNLAIREARTYGADPGQVLEVIAHYRRHAAAHGWTARELYYRVGRTRPLIGAEADWPARKGSQPAAAAIDLEARQGATLAALDETQLRELVAVGDAVLRTWAATVRRLGDLKQMPDARRKLLQLLELRSHHDHGTITKAKR